MLTGDIRSLVQSPNDVISANDARQGWSGEVGEEGIVNMTFLQVPALMLGIVFLKTHGLFKLFVGNQMIDMFVEQTNLSFCTEEDRR